LLSPAFIDELRSRTTLSTLIGRSVKLQKAGREFKACCPFHNEKSPSFYVNDEKGFYHCFGCGAHGDAIRFLTEAKGLPFMDAVKDLAAAAGMDLPAPDPAARARAERASGLIGVTEAAAAWYRKQLGGIEGAGARAYLDKRGIGAHAREAFGIGFAPDGRNRIAPALADVKEAELVEAGLLIQPDRDSGGPAKAYDRFRGRLMIPIRDARGRTIAFGGRILDSGEPKYLNSPDTPLFDKGRTLFNLDRAGPVARKSGRAIVVEGYLDVIALDQAGIGEAMAPLGTALTEAQMARLWSLVDAPILCFDGDAAGRKAGLRAAHRALPILRPGKTLRFAMLPPGKDPDDIVRAGGAQAFEAAIADPVPLDILLYQEARAAADVTLPEGRAGLRHTLNELAASCGDRLLAEEYRRAFNNLFFEEFGFKKVERRSIASAALRLAANDNRTDVHHSLVWAALKGLSQRPGLIASVMEDLHAIKIDVPDLARWRAALCSASHRNCDLDTGVLDAILLTTFLPEVLEFNLTKHLRFSFLRPGCNEQEAAEQLLELIRKLADDGLLEETERMLGAELIAATVADDAEAYESAAAEYAALREHRAASIERARELREMAELAIAA
jgi:DNA primase